MLVITSNPKKYRTDLGNDVVWSCNYNTAAGWALKRYPDRGYIHYKTLEGTAKGKECLILGYGPSRKRFKSLDYGGAVFAINRAIDEAPSADYWCAHEVDVIKSHATYRSGGSNLITQGANSIFDGFQEATARLRVIMIDAASDPLRWPKETRPLYWNEITFGWVLHLAIRMGFDRIYTLGIDLTQGYGPGVHHPGMSDTELRRQHYGVQVRTEEMFVNPIEKAKWYEREVEILDLSGGNLPVTKVHGLLPAVEA